MRRLIKFTIAAAAMACLAVPASAGTAAADPAPEPVPGYNLMGPPPEGANDWNCKPSAAHPRPVVLVHGTGSSMQMIFPYLAPMLKNEGYCVFALNYGGIPTWYNPNLIAWGVADIHRSAGELGAFVDAVLAHTGAGQVDLVGHSQGGLVSRQYMKFNGGQSKVNALVALGATNHGTTFNGLQQLYSLVASIGLANDKLTHDLAEWMVFGMAGHQQLVGSGLITQLNAGGEALPGVKYTMIATRNDEVVTPPEYSFLSTAGGNVDNKWVQDGCPTNTVSHGGLLDDPRSLWMVMTALDPSYANRNAEPCKA